MYEILDAVGMAFLVLGIVLCTDVFGVDSAWVSVVVG